ncbi:hypothetical protein NECAME_02722 [Necator americanus]|uniref:Uncharacterized protein n=1 Tax=Necator americanus TaxID=51031 RepID=W2TDQ0_NECAM|nr:hypothetical protein NECAME_02722 [Necator americanus]ETN79296.1 hypothetical protein NECAME_02722 [Necator americanus]
MKIKHNIRWMAETSHIAGTVENAVLIRRLADEYARLKFKVKTYNYSVLLNYPDFENPNTIKVEKEDGIWWRLSRGRGHPSGPPQAVNEVVYRPSVAYKILLHLESESESEIYHLILKEKL